MLSANRVISQYEEVTHYVALGYGFASAWRGNRGFMGYQASIEYTPHEPDPGEDVQKCGEVHLSLLIFSRQN
jgi:hypothetical protein